MDNYNNIFNNTQFEALFCQKSIVGSKVNSLDFYNQEYDAPPDADNLIFDWNSSPEKPFKNIESNRIYYVYDGKAKLNTTRGEFDLEKGYVYFFPSNTIISSSCDDTMSHYYVHFNLINNFNIFEFIDFPICRKVTDDFIMYLNNIRKLNNVLKDKNLSLGQMLEIEGSLKLLLGFFMQDVGMIDPYIKKFEKSIIYIGNNLDKRIKLSDLAKIECISEVYYSTLFTKTFKMSPNKYINLRKLVRAKHLLLNTHMAINEVASECGFDDQFYFSNWYAKQEKMSPKEYRNKALNRD